MARCRHLAAIALALLEGSGADAHHSGAVFDLDTLIELRGEVVDFKLRSPHASFVIDARLHENGEPSGPLERWEVEWESAPMLRTIQIDTETFAPGDEIAIVAFPHRDPEFRFAKALAVDDAFGARHVMANSDRLFSPSVRQAAAAVGSDRLADENREAIELGPSGAGIEGRWQQPFLTFPVDTPGLPLNEAGMNAWRTYDAARSPANTCEPINVPDLLSAPFFLLDLRIEEEQAVLHHEAYGVVRTVPLRGAPALVEPGRRFGAARGRMDGDVLVVESHDFAPSAWGLGIEEMHGGGIVPSSPAKTLTERFAVTPDGTTLVYVYVLLDTTYMTAPHTGRVELTRVPDETPMHPYECDVESASMWSRTRGEAALRIGADPR